MTLDLLIRGGTVLDGTGEPGYQSDVGVGGGRIVLGAADTTARRVIDATGLVVCPGFIDMHAHSDLRLLREPAHEHAVAQGVTCEVLGQDGLAYAPIDDVVLPELYGRIRGWNGAPPSDGFSWRSVAGYLDRIDQGAAVSACYLAPHGTIRMLAMGTDARQATPAELRAMAELVDQAMREGAFGLSTGLTYAPAMHASTDELVALCRVVAERGGYFAPHHRSYGAGALEAYAECIDVSRRSGAPVHLTHAHMNFAPNKGRAPELLAMVDQARSDGLDVTLDTYPYLAGSSYLHAFLPSWAQTGTVDDIVARLGDHAVRERLRVALEVEGCDGSHGVPVDWSTVVISAVSDPAHSGSVGLSIAKLAQRAGREPLDVYLELLVGDRLGATCLIHAGHEENVRAIMRHPAHMAGSDALVEGDRPHPRGFGTFVRYLGHYVRDEHVVSLPEMVRKMTSSPARRLGLRDRGRIASGMAADLVCFDPTTVNDRATYEVPRQSPDGVPYVVVNGTVVIDEGTHTGALPGRALRHFVR